MNRPVYKHSKVLYTISAILTIPLLIDICTACHLFSLWIAWLLFTIICGISAVRLWFGFSQKCYKFAWGLIAQLLLGAGVLTFFQLSYTNVIETPVSHPITPAVVNIAPPVIEHDTVPKTDTAEKKEEANKKTDDRQHGETAGR
ncbi:MAG: hypothetical protein J1E78_05045 [Muribaculaceae bacterium]|nr:hypothetical protein [Muribaculaceae bacterium]